MSNAITTTLATHIPENNNNVDTIFVPVTSAFSPPAGCDQQFMKWDGQVAVWDPGYALIVDPDALVCHPPAMTSWWDGGHITTIDDARTKYSMGPLVCPSPYTTAESPVSVVGQSRSQVSCCPTSYTYRGGKAVGNLGECVSPLTQGQVITYMKRLDVPVTTVTLTSTTSVRKTDSWSRVVSTVPSATTTEYVYAIPMNGIIFDAQVQSATSSGGSSLAAASSAASTSAASSTTPVPESQGMSSGAKVGLGVGLGLGAVALIALFALLMLRRRNKRKAIEVPPPQEMQYSPNPSQSHSSTPMMASGDAYSGYPKHDTQSTVSPVPYYAPPHEQQVHHQQFPQQQYPQQHAYQPQFPSPQAQTQREYHEMPATGDQRTELP